MNHLGYALDNWIFKLENNFVLRTICGFTANDIPAVASYYDLSIALSN